jgi:hypothetical protein
LSSNIDRARRQVGEAWSELRAKGKVPLWSNAASPQPMLRLAAGGSPTLSNLMITAAGPHSASVRAWTP